MGFYGGSKNTVSTSGPAVDSTARNLAQAALGKLYRVERPEAHGAVGDGVANDTAAIQATFDAAAQNKAIVAFEPGSTYKCSAPLSYPSGLVQIEGNGSRLQFTSNTFDLLSLGQPGLSQVNQDDGYVHNLAVYGPGGDDANAQPPNNGKGGIVWHSTRHARTINCRVNNVDEAYDLRGNCYGHKNINCRTKSTCNVGILLRGGSGTIAGSGSDIQIIGFWGGGHKAAFWCEGNAGGYWFTDCKPGGGWQSAPAPIEAYGVWVFGPTYDAQTTVTAAVAVNASTITVADASKLFTNEIVINGQEIEILSKSGNTLTVATSASGGWQQNYNVKTAIPAGAGVQVTSGVGNVSIKGGGIEGTHDMHALRLFRDVAGLGISDFSFYSNGAAGSGVNQMIQVLKHTGEGSCSVEFSNCIVQGDWTGATPLTMTTRWKNANQVTEIGTTHNFDVPPSFGGVGMNLIDKPMVSRSSITGGVALAKNLVFIGGRGVRVNAGALEISSSDTLSSWAAITGAASTNEFPGPVKVVNTSGYVLQAGDAGGLVIYDVGGTAGTYVLPSGVSAGYTVSVSQGFSGQLTVTAAGSSGPDGIRTPTGIFGTVKTKTSGSIIKFVKDSGTRWYALPFGDSYVAP